MPIAIEGVSSLSDAASAMAELACSHLGKSAEIARLATAGLPLVELPAKLHRGNRRWQEFFNGGDVGFRREGVIQPAASANPSAWRGPALKPTIEGLTTALTLTPSVCRILWSGMATNDYGSKRAPD